MRPWKSLEGLRREVWILAGAVFINRAGTMVVPFMTLYMTQEIGASASTAGLALAVYGVGSLVSAPVFGAIADRFGRVKLMVASLLASGVVLVVFPAARGIPAIFALTLLLAVVSEGLRPASMALVGEWAPGEKRRPAFALIRLAVNLGMSMGPALGGWLAERSYHSLFWVDGATSLAAGVIIVLARLRDPEPPAHGERPGSPFAALSDRRLAAFLLAMVPVTLVFFQHASSLSLYMVRDLGLPRASYGLLFTINTLIIVAIEVPISAAIARWRAGQALALGAMLVAIGFGAMAFARTTPAIVATTVVWTFGEMLWLPSASAYVSEIAPRGRTGEYMGLYSMVFGFALLTGPWIGATVLDGAGAAALWIGCFAGAALSAALLFRMGEKVVPSAP